MNTLIAHKLDFDGRREAESLVAEIIDDPDKAAYEIVGLRQLGRRLVAYASNRGHTETCMTANDEMRDALAGLPTDERNPGDYDYRCSCGLSKLLEDAKGARLT